MVLPKIFVLPHFLPTRAAQESPIDINSKEITATSFGKKRIVKNAPINTQEAAVNLLSSWILKIFPKAVENKFLIKETFILNNSARIIKHVKNPMIKIALSLPKKKRYTNAIKADAK